MLAFPPVGSSCKHQGLLLWGDSRVCGALPHVGHWRGRADWPRALDRGPGGMNRNKKDVCLTALCGVQTDLGRLEQHLRRPLGEMSSPTLTVLLGGQVTVSVLTVRLLPLLPPVFSGEDLQAQGLVSFSVLFLGFPPGTGGQRHSLCRRSAPPLRAQSCCVPPGCVRRRTNGHCIFSHL